jgi:hypothetical protein
MASPYRLPPSPARSALRARGLASRARCARMTLARDRRIDPATPRFSRSSCRWRETLDLAMAHLEAAERHRQSSIVSMVLLSDAAGPPANAKLVAASILFSADRKRSLRVTGSGGRVGWEAAWPRQSGPSWERTFGEWAGFVSSRRGGSSRPAAGAFKKSEVPCRTGKASFVLGHGSVVHGNKRHVVTSWNR